MTDLVERLLSHMGKADMGDILRDCREAAARIAALEAALRKIEINVEASMDVFMRTQAIASAALTPEKDK